MIRGIGRSRALAVFPSSGNIYPQKCVFSASVSNRELEIHTFGDIPPVWEMNCYSAAMTSISTSPPPGKFFTAKAARAGNGA